jgi:hypothetical protein
MSKTGKFYRLGDIELKMLEQLVQLDKEGVYDASMTSVLQELIRDAWFQKLATHKLTMKSKTYYFLDEADQKSAASMVKEYEQQEFMVDDQLVSYIMKKNNGLLMN